MLKKFILFIYIMIFIVPFAGCTVMDNGDFPVVVGHTRFDSAVIKTVVLSDNVADIIIEMGYESKISARSDECTQNKIGNIISVGKKDSPDIDKIKAQRPDVVIADDTISKDSYKALNDSNIKVLRFFKPATREDLSIMYQKINTLFEGKTNGDKNGMAKFEKVYNSLLDNAKSLPDISQAKTVCYLYDCKGKTVTGDMLGSVIFKASGATNIADAKSGGYIDIKTIKKVNPQYIFCDVGLRNMLVKNSDFKNLIAVKNKHVIEIPCSSFGRYGSGMLKTAKRITRILFPAGKSSSVADNYKIVFNKNVHYKIGSGADTAAGDVDGSRDTIIKIQSRLDDLGYWPLNDKTGYYGETTAVAVSQFQSTNHINSKSGEVDYKTLSKMFSDDAIARSEPVQKHTVI